MENITLVDAKDRLEERMERAVRGEDVCISDPKLGSVRLTPAKNMAASDQPLYPKRIPGLMKGKFHISDEKLLEPLTDEELAWLSGETSP